ncbi:hypothetical protein LZ32DRAFT_225032 [Colletotrichum eremochloae]|nr:hypothetical protein LZ32DRAFT_225032 [Colletotrichum eremochloae]
MRSQRHAQLTSAFFLYSNVSASQSLGWLRSYGKGIRGIRERERSHHIGKKKSGFDAGTHEAHQLSKSLLRSWS